MDKFSSFILQLGENYKEDLNGLLIFLETTFKTAPLREKANFHSEIGIKLVEFSYFELALVTLNKAVEHYIEMNDKKGESMCYGNIGVVYYSLCDFHKAIDYYKKSLEIKIEIGDKAEEAGCYTNIGVVHGDLGNYQQALKYLNKSLEINLIMGNKPGESECYTNLGNVYYRASHNK